MIDGAGIGVLAQVPDVFQQPLARDDLAVALDEIAQQIRFHQRQVMRARADVQLLRVEIDRPAGKRIQVTPGLRARLPGDPALGEPGPAPQQ